MDVAAHFMRDEVKSIANPEYRRMILRDQSGHHPRGVLVIDRRRPPRKDQPSRPACPNIIRRSIERHYLAINAGLADASRNQLSVLGTEVEYDYRLVTCL